MKFWLQLCMFTLNRCLLLGENPRVMVSFRRGRHDLIQGEISVHTLQFDRIHLGRHL